MSSLTRQDVEKIATLARLYLTDEELDRYLHQLSDVLDYVEQLAELDLDDVPPTAHAVAQQNVMRADQITSDIAVADALANAAQTADDQFAIQAVFDIEEVTP